ncbi:hypothetical protein [Ponticaulis sp.]|uniref:poly(ethylene terephthalate) hydrolase family protein n=1 Tax=Ponticaulis sp. TaxID=2020902 RepID=UPI002616E154|nr:hypothetical protein [Ponticaulis sp.]MDF1681151.1 hypothetical protein [Ponticaulis sp.]
MKALWISTALLTHSVIVGCTAGTTETPQSSSATPPLSGMDMSLLTSSATEPDGPGTQLGPYPDIVIAPAPGLPTHTIYYPENSGEKALPVLVWGNGACRNDGRSFYRTLTKVASHGFFVVAVGLYDTHADAPSTTGPQMIEAIDWLESGPSLPAGLGARIDADSIAVMGQSCGGLMTIEASDDPRVDTIGVINSGVFNAGSRPGLSISTATKDDLALIHTPTLYINGGSNDVAFENSNDDFERIDNVPLFYGVMEGAGHIATHRHRNGGRFAEVITAWLEWQLKDNSEAESWFVGADCMLCSDPEWIVQKKNLN